VTKRRHLIAALGRQLQPSGGMRALLRAGMAKKHYLINLSNSYILIPIAATG